jgi:predicted enzyme related to lactoylglutathione lyase
MQLLGLRTAIYRVTNLEAAKSWYNQVLGKPPYFDQPFYVGFEVGGYELGLLPIEASQDRECQTYWGVEDAASAFQALLAQGASTYEEPFDVGDGIMVAMVKDPFGSLLGVIQNPHFKISQ